MRAPFGDAARGAGLLGRADQARGIDHPGHAHLGHRLDDARAADAGDAGGGGGLGRTRPRPTTGRCRSRGTAAPSSPGRSRPVRWRRGRRAGRR